MTMTTKKATEVAPPAAPVPTAVAVQGLSNSLAHLSGGVLAALASHAKEVVETENPATGAISTRAGVLQYQGKAMPGNCMTVIVVAASYENTYYPHAFDPNNIASPVCFAQSLTDVAMAPHPTACRDMQNETCAGCWAHEWKSDPKGGKGKACKQVRKLAIIPAYGSTEEVLAAEMATLRVPVMSVKNWSTYANDRAAMDGLPYFVFLTEISVVPDPRSQFQVRFAKVELLQDEEMIKAVMSRRAQAEKLLLAPYGMAPEAPPEPPPPQATGRKKY